MRKRIVLIEDDVQLAETYSLIIGSTGKYEIAGHYRSVADALKAFKKTIPDIVLMDITLEGGVDGIEGTRIIKEKYPPIQIIVLTVYENDENVFNCLKAGAIGYLTKSQQYTDILEALEEIEQGGAPMSSKIARMVVSDFHVNFNSPLTHRERQILTNLASGKSYSQIAEELNISKETSKTHIRNIYTKLNVHSKWEALEKAKREYYI